MESKGVEPFTSCLQSISPPRRAPLGDDISWPSHVPRAVVAAFVRVAGFEPAAFRFQAGSSSRLSYTLFLSRGDQRELNSHRPGHIRSCRPLHHGHHVVPELRLELRFTASKTAVLPLDDSGMVLGLRFELRFTASETVVLPVGRSQNELSARRDSNPQPLAYRASALTIELRADESEREELNLRHLVPETSAWPLGYAPLCAPNSDRTSTFRSSDGRADRLRHRGKLAGFGSPAHLRMLFVCQRTVVSRPTM